MEVQSHAQLAMALLVPCLWMAASSGLIMLNKMLLKDLGADLHSLQLVWLYIWC